MALWDRLFSWKPRELKPDMNPLCAAKLMALAARSETILEWGSGGSTIEMLKHISPTATIYSYEHDKKYYDRVKRSLNTQVKYFLVTPEDYALSPPDIHYSMIFVDGIEREACLERARCSLSWDALLLHDVDRARYAPWMARFGADQYVTETVDNLWICRHRGQGS